MALDLTAFLRRVPKWAWFTSAGVGLGGVALYTFRNRAGTAEPTDEEATPQYGVPDSYTPSPVPGIVVPDINVGGGATGENGYLDLHNAYLDGLGQILDFSINRPLPAPAIPIDYLPDFLSYFGGGGAPASSFSEGSVQVAPPPAAPPRPAPAPKPPPAKHAVDTCHSSFNNESGNCKSCSRTRYSDGSWGGFFNCHVVHKGKCGKYQSCGGATGKG